MSDIVISVEGLSKQYRLGQVGGTTLREDLQRWWARVRGQPDPTLKVDQVDRRAEGGKLKAEGSAPSSSPQVSGLLPPPSSSPQVSGLLPHPSEPKASVGSPPSGLRSHPSSLQRPSPYVWALKDVSFEVRRGEVLGIIGRNGAGKSTLLKILSRITAPTTGRVKVKGRIASLLEVGTGMHPELTGRENIYLNGAILGMTKAEITRKLDEIIAFSGVERFIDTPVKRYSSGMMVRLGFAVAAHLEPEILIVDEVLAVGDAEFQKKCLGKMSEVAHGGRTVLFVSHNMAAVESLTRRCLMFDAGELREVGDTPDVIAAYLGSSSKGDLGPGREPPDVRSGNGKARICSVCCYGPDLRPVDGVQCGRPLGIQVRYAVSRPTAALCLRMTVYTSARTPVAHLDSAISGVTLGQTEGSHVVRCHVDCLNLAPGRYFLNVGLEDPEGVADHLEEAVFLVVWASDYLGTGKLPTQHGVVVFRARWSVTGI